MLAAPCYAQAPAKAAAKTSVSSLPTTEHGGATAHDADAIRPFRINVPEEALLDLRRRVVATRWPERETVTDQSQGVQLAKIQPLIQYWGTGYDWRKAEAKLNALPQFVTTIDGVDIQFVHVKSQLAYFNGYAMWTYYNLPFLLGEPAVEATEIPSIADGDSVLRGLRVRFPREIHSHSPEQSLYFDDSGLLRRQDYEVDVAGRGRAAHLISDYIDVQGLLFPTRRRVFMRNADGTLQFDKMPVSIDLSDFELS
jgi:hypothetical protein